ncbi:hypothetical protein WA577_006833, partial [Blastocystis sp. JDR]
MYNGMRTYAEEALGSATMCPQNVISHIPLVLEYSDCIEKLTEDYPDLCFVAKKAENGEIVFELKDYAVPEVSLTHVMSMLLRYIFGFITKKYPENVKHTVVSVPPGVSPAAARQVADAALLAGFEDVKVVTTDLAQAFNYCFRLHNAVEPLEGEHNVVFMDCGCTFSNMYKVRLTPEKCEVVKSVNKKVGAKDVDVSLYRFFAQKLQTDRNGQRIEENAIAKQTKKAFRLMNGCCALKKMLSAANRAVNNVDALDRGNDYTLSLTRAEFESICAPQIQQVTELVDAFLKDDAEPIEAIEMVGGGSRIPFVKRIVEERTKSPLRYTVDSASCIAKGCALLGVYEEIKEKSAMHDVPFVELAPRDEASYAAMEACEAKLRALDSEHEKKAEAHNKLEGLIDQMWRELDSEDKALLDEAALSPVLRAESAWLMDNEETVDAAGLEKEFAEFKAKLETQFAAFFEAKEKRRIAVEKALEEESKKRVDNTDKDDVKLPFKTRMSRVEANKKEATELFKDKNFVMAIQHYKRALSHCYKFFDLSPQQKEEVKALQATLNVNCAICYMKLEQWDKVIEHCSTVLKEDATNRKALFRRADAYNHVRDIEKCSQDLKQLLVIMPDDAGVRRLKAENDRQIKELQERRKRMAKKMFGA